MAKCAICEKNVSFRK